MIVVKAIRVGFLTRDTLGISWEVRDHFEDISIYRFEVLRSNSPEGPYVEISPQLTDTYRYNDVGVNLHSKHREWYYRIRVTNTVTSVAIEFGSFNPDEVALNDAAPGGVAPEAPPDIIVEDARSKLDLVLREFTGRRCLWFPKRTFGQKCGCIDELTQKRTISHCKQCFDTGFTGGFFNPIEVYLQVGPSTDQDVLHWIGELEPRQAIGLMNGRYRPKPGDIVFEIEGRRWVVDRVQVTEKLRARVRNTIVMHELAKSDTEFDIQVTWNRDSLTASPIRQFLPTTDVESYRKALSDLNQV